MVINRPRPGIDRIASPANPAAASRPVARTAYGCVARPAPATRSGETNGVHALVPRRTSVSDTHSVVTLDDSMKSRNGGLTRDRISSGTSHHRQARTEPSSHQPPNRSQRAAGPRRGACSSHHNTATDAAASVATAFTAPINASAHAD